MANGSPYSAQARFEAAIDPLDAGAGLVDETGRGALRGGHTLLVAQATRALNSFEAVIATCRIGRGVQAGQPQARLLQRAQGEGGGQALRQELLPLRRLRQVPPGEQVAPKGDSQGLG